MPLRQRPAHHRLRALVPVAVPFLLLSSACSASHSEYARSSYPASVSVASYGGETVTESVATSDSSDSRTAQFEIAAPSSTPTALAVVVPSSAAPEETASDAVQTSGPLLIYTARVDLAVYEVRETQAALVERARELGGFVATQSDQYVVLRIPAVRFQGFLANVATLGDVLHRELQAQDVGEEFRDVELRIRNLEVTRTRVEALLAQATNVEQALAVQRELERITAELESLRGRQRFLADRIAFSTLTVTFQPRPREAGPRAVQLPFRWLDQLGLSSLLEVR